MRFRDLVDWNVYWLLFIVAEFSLLAALPYSITLTGEAIYDLGVSLPTVLATQFAQATVLFLVSIFTGLYLGKRTGLGTPVLDSLFRTRNLPANYGSVLKLSVFLGILVSFIIFILDRFVFSIFSEPLTVHLMTPPLWERFLYSFYTGFVEEIVLRFFLMTLLVWISWKIKRTSQGLPTSAGVWMAILIVSFIYGLGYLSSSLSASMEQVQMIAILLFNALAGIAFGWLYWKKGLEAAIIANLTSSLMIFVVLGSLL
jgi:hypothetical protein